MDMGIPPLGIKIMLESSPLKSRILVQSLAVGAGGLQGEAFFGFLAAGGKGQQL